ncbi:hypothetical protein ACS0TY_017440 [Phlomoides rotata]
MRFLKHREKYPKAKPPICGRGLLARRDINRGICMIWQPCKEEDKGTMNPAIALAIFQQKTVTTRIRTRDVGVVLPQSPCHLPSHMCP